MNYVPPIVRIKRNLCQEIDSNNGLLPKKRPHRYDRDKFPIECLPPPARDLVMNIHYQVECAIAAVASTLFGVCSIVSQDKIRVRKSENHVSPVTLWFLTAQPSGERKTALLNILMKIFREYDRRQEIELQNKISRYENELVLWKRKRELMVKMAVKEQNANFLMGMVNQMSVDRYLEMLEAQDKNRPVKPKVRRLIYEDTTIAALIKGLADYSSTTSIVTDEFSHITRNGLLTHPGSMCKTFDGSILSSDRVSTGAKRIYEPLITLLLMGQPEIINSYIEKHWSTLDSTGFISRLLISSLESTAGDKISENAIEPNLELINQFNKRITQLLETESEGNEPKILEFTPEAEKLLKDYSDLVEKQMTEGAIYARFRAYASRLSDKLARLSAILTYVFGGGGSIDAKTVRNCIKIIDWYTNQYVGIFGFQSMTVDERNVLLLGRWLCDKSHEKRISVFDRIHIRRYGPNAIRKQSLLDAALYELASSGHVILMRNPDSGQEGVAINSSLFDYILKLDQQSMNRTPSSSLYNATIHDI